jgi:hypothetical protein
MRKEETKKKYRQTRKKGRGTEGVNKTERKNMQITILIIIILRTLYVK